MILLWLIVVLLAGGLFAALAARSHPLLCRWIALFAVSLDLALVLVMTVRDFGFGRVSTSQWIEQMNWGWIPQSGIRFHLGLDGLSLLLILLTLFLGVVSVVISWTDITSLHYS